MDWINYTLFTLGTDRPVLLIDLITSILGLACVFLAGRRSKYNFWVGYLYTAALFVMFWNKNLYASLLLQPVSLVINIIGHYRWTHPKENEQSSKDAGALKVSMLSWTERLFSFPGRPSPLSGHLRNRSDSGCAVSERPEKMGLLGCMAARQRHSACAASVCRTRLYANCMFTLPCQWHMVAGKLGKRSQKRRMIYG